MTELNKGSWRDMLRTQDIETLERQFRDQEPKRGTSKEIDHRPLVKLFNPMGAATWLLTELEPGTSIAFGLCDLGLGFPELGLVDLEEVWDIRLPGGLHMERDIHFRAERTIGEYAAEARRLGYIRA